MSLEIIWGTRSRGGSQFLLKLTTAVLGSRLEPQSRLSGARKEGLKAVRHPSWDDFVAAGRPWEYFRQHDIRSLKIEEPGIDEFGNELLTEFPGAKWLANYRRIEDIVVSHYNLRWGFTQAKLVRLMEQNLKLYERLHERGLLFVIDIDDPTSFSLINFCKFLDAPVTSEAEAISASWGKVNDLSTLRAASGDGRTEKMIPADLGSLRTRFPEIERLERRYMQLLDAVQAA